MVETCRALSSVGFSVCHHSNRFTHNIIDIFCHECCNSVMWQHKLFLASLLLIPLGSHIYDWSLVFFLYINIPRKYWRIILNKYSWDMYVNVDHLVLFPNGKKQLSSFPHLDADFRIYLMMTNSTNALIEHLHGCTCAHAVSYKGNMLQSWGDGATGGKAEEVDIIV